MKLSLREATPESIETAKKIYGADNGDLTAAALPFGWPLPAPNDVDLARRRAEWSCQQQKDTLVTDPTVRFMQVVDVDKDDEIVAFGRWHRYTKGFELIGDLEICGCKDRNDTATWPDGFNGKGFIAIMESLFSQRSEWLGSQYCWVLTNLKTREPLQKHGAGTMLLKWGLDRAAEEGVPAYLEAALSAAHLYESVGFKDVGRMMVDCGPIGSPGTMIELVKMKAEPSGLQKVHGSQ